MQSTNTIQFLDDLEKGVRRELLQNINNSASAAGKEYYFKVLERISSSSMYKYILMYFENHIEHLHEITDDDGDDSPQYIDIQLLCYREGNIEETICIPIVERTPSHIFFLLASVVSVYSNAPRIFNQTYFQQLKNAVSILRNNTDSHNSCMMLINDILYIISHSELAEMHPGLSLAAKIDVNRMLEGTLRQARPFAYTNPTKTTEMQINAINNYINQKQLPYYSWVNLAAFRQMRHGEQFYDYSMYIIGTVYNYVVSDTPIIVSPPFALPAVPCVARPMGRRIKT